MPESTSKSGSTNPKPKPQSAKSTDPFYAVSPIWKDVTPIPLIDGPPNQKDPGPALATIAYAPRYTEAMSYLRAVMAVNEFSRRALELTEDIIGMNPAHYTVWLYRAKILKELWEREGTSTEDGVMEELDWLEGVSERNLKNYQIWHHRQLLVSLLPRLPPTETDFLAYILSFDSKNYHVWTYRQWLCCRFPDPLLSTDVELQALDALINEDVRNNSAWNHRYFICFGAEELRVIESEGGNRKEVLASGNLVVDEDVVEREINYAKDHIAWAPQNPSPWNYLKGVIKRAGIPITDLQVYCESFVGGRGADLMGDKVRSSHAIDWLADIYRLDGNLERSRACLEALGKKWDPIRRKYWDYRAKQLTAGDDKDSVGSK
ncbi:uncharacterized protein Z518_04543 [Rhinocladiella mackenziei CBS 650.93]|uniref:Protein farnesyltransferase/geranylgeranyltransferase type-1 subunit alpha n=1 Tax=Rhinocladiella mackenziei CBS 650.93 TaxID=1442369 RepID=A0A0D2FWJ1_9EURO|nr:uncharacterized protein Z518_04543 [Rhinocladiella mackenziei CBS 650.93]KIX06567.1 hypothetical protein Z518_04543 [Rhinocladiella mackenziei CBS 650.93]